MLHFPKNGKKSVKFENNFLGLPKESFVRMNFNLTRKSHCAISQSFHQSKGYKKSMPPPIVLGKFLTYFNSEAKTH